MDFVPFDHVHEFISVEDLKIDGEREAICMLCEEPSSIPYLKCSLCNYHCHESCQNLPDEIEHPLHPIHSLYWKIPNRTRFCHACGKDCGKSHLYDCNDCNFSLHFKCTSLRPANKDDGHQHEFVRFLKDSQFICELCGEDGKDLRCVCSICYLLVHAGCAWFSDTIKIVLHPHSLVLTYSVPQVKEQADKVCKLCSLKVNTEYAAYYCQQCNYATHLMCAKEYQLFEDGKSFDDSVPMEINQWFSQGFVDGLIKDINSEVRERSLPPKIQHFSHQHALILNNKETLDDQVCEGCMQLITIPLYSCIDCNFFLHYLCTQLPRRFTFSRVLTTFDLMSHVPSSDGTFKCYFCHCHRHGFAYTWGSEDDKCISDIQCAIVQERFRHECHPHSFFPTVGEYLTCKSCGNSGLLKCFRCGFAICHRCASFPIEATHSAHPKCVIGKFSFLKFGKTYKDQNHQHPLTFIQKTKDSSPCHICNISFKGMALHCKECKLNFHPRFGSNCLGEEKDEEEEKQEEGESKKEDSDCLGGEEPQVKVKEEKEKEEEEEEPWVGVKEKEQEREVEQEKEAEEEGGRGKSLIVFEEKSLTMR